MNLPMNLLLIQKNVLETLDNDALTVFLVLEIFNMLRLKSLQLKETLEEHALGNVYFVSILSKQGLIAFFCSF